MATAKNSPASSTSTSKEWDKLDKAGRAALCNKHMPGILKTEKALEEAREAFESAKADLTKSIQAFLTEGGNRTEAKVDGVTTVSYSIPAFNSKHAKCMIQPITRKTNDGLSSYLKRLSQDEESY